MPRVFFVPPPPPLIGGLCFSTAHSATRRTTTSGAIIPGLGWHVAFPAPLPARSVLPAFRAYKDPPPPPPPFN